jgi:hypothetical protein
MSSGETKDAKSLRSKLLGPETTSDDLVKKLGAAEELLSYLESEYQTEREKLSSLVFSCA